MKKKNSFTNRLLKRHQKKLSFFSCIKSGIKGLIAISGVSALGYFSDHTLIIAPFAASCITIFTTPDDEFAQPINVIGGYFIATALGLITVHLFPHEWWALGPMLAITISTMAYFRVTHPPAGAVPFLLYFYHSDAGPLFLVLPTMTGCIALVSIALVLQRLPKSRKYPRNIK